MTSRDLLYYAPGFIVTGLLTYVIARLYIRHALNKGILDRPNARSSHTAPTPRGGGISIVTVSAIIIATALLAPSTELADKLPQQSLAALLLGSLIVAAVGFMDDLKSLSNKVRFSTHLLASLAALSLIKPLPSLPFPGMEIQLQGAWLLPLALGLTWLINLYNFMDGIDGIAATEAFSVLVGASLIGGLGQQLTDYPFPSSLLIMLLAPLLGFLLLNRPPAKVFMGDGCSGFLGMLLGLLAINYAANTSVNLWCWAILLGVFIVDSGWTLSTRVFTGQKWDQPHRSHCYQILSRKLQSHGKVTLGTAAVNLLWLTPLAFLASLHPNYGAFCLLAAYTPLVALCYRHEAGLHN